MPSLILQARAKLAFDRQAERRREREEAEAAKGTANDLYRKFVHQIPTLLPTFTEMLCEWHSVVDTKAENLAQFLVTLSDFQGFTFIKKDIGLGKLPLMQKQDYETNGGNYHYNAWAIQFSCIYNVHIYLIPYQDPKKGLACSVFNSATREKIAVYPHDIPREMAVYWMAEWLKVNEK